MLELRLYRLAGLALLAAAFWGAAPAASAQEITVSAAASLQNAMRDIGTAYQAVHPGRKVNFNFAASGPLLAQIAQGAPVDVFASADTETMDQAQARQLIKPDTRMNFAANELVLVSPASRPAGLKALADLKKPGIARIAVGTPATVPAGRYARAALTPQGLWAELNPKFVFADNVRQALNYVSRGEADAGFVYRTDALIDRDKVRIDLVVPTARPVLYPMALVSASQNAAAATDFMRFVTGASGQALLARHGFRPAP
ncbi:MAG: molybdate ABC transporter substrate-binding protein [Rubrivivax sp.]|nr:MAG: molybdate ABC transporter substrate-binding protein [Rubrivivax sp.]